MATQAELDSLKVVKDPPGKKLFAYTNSSGKTIFNTEQDIAYPNGDSDYSYNRTPEYDITYNS